MPDDDHGPPATPAGLADERFAANIRETRERLKMSQGELARRMSSGGWPYYQQTVRRVEEGKRKVSVGEAKALAEILGESVDRLTWPGREASAAALLDQVTARAESAWEQIGRGTATLRWAQFQLEVSIAEAERARFYGSPKIRQLVDEARRARELTPEEAVEAGEREHASLREAGKSD